MGSDSRQERVGAVIAAAGESRRMQGVDKVLAPVAGRPLLSYVLDALEDCPPVNRMVVVVRAAIVEEIRRLVAAGSWRKALEVVAGGSRRQDSVLTGLARLEDCAWVVVHDGARPCVTPELVTAGLEAATETGAAIAGLPVSDTLKQVSAERFVLGTIDREGLWSAQTPQVFRRDLLLRAHRAIGAQELGYEATDDAALVERLGVPLKVYPGSSENLKVTTPADLALAEAILRRRSSVAPTRAGEGG